MKKNILFVALLAATLCSCDQFGNKKADESAQLMLDSLQRIIDEKDVELDDIMGSINEVQEGIRRINEAQGRVTIADGNRESASSKEVIRENMEFIQEAMQQNRDMIAQLKEKLRTSTFNADKLAKTIENLQRQVEEQAARIQELEAAIADRDTLLAAQGEQISSLTAENASKAATVAEQDKELNTAWFVFGTTKELKEQKILTKGDVLKNGDFNKDYFTRIDIRYDKEIKLYSKSAKLLTSHPAGSYNLLKDREGQYELHITDPARFWSVSKYLVVQVK
ncbi:MAG: hypothetical protein II645_00045 [Bacteroidaceae bacterium]|nr:hypothetical protein [Bacteroidaceae bacterium]MBQ2595830.1 hypothetical protein [Bacteroidaceae bacterium]MBQ3991527.1 hypothetical protein [Bacteroidaceae bacterium]